MSDNRAKILIENLKHKVWDVVLIKTDYYWYVCSKIESIQIGINEFDDGVHIKYVNDNYDDFISDEIIYNFSRKI